MQSYVSHISHTDLSSIPVRSAVNLTSWFAPNLSKRALSRFTVLTSTTTSTECRLVSHFFLPRPLVFVSAARSHARIVQEFHRGIPTREFTDCLVIYHRTVNGRATANTAVDPASVVEETQWTKSSAIDYCEIKPVKSRRNNFQKNFLNRSVSSKLPYRLLQPEHDPPLSLPVRLRHSMYIQ